MPARYDDPDFRASERAVARRRLIAAAIVCAVFTGVAGASVTAAFVSAHDDRADAHGVAAGNPQV